MAYASVPSAFNETETCSSKIQGPGSGVFTVQELASSLPVVMDQTSDTAVYRDPASETAVVQDTRTDSSMVKDSKTDSPLVYASTRNSTVVCANKRDSPVVHDITKKFSVHHDTNMDPYVIQEPESSSSEVQDPHCVTPLLDLSSKTRIVQDTNKHSLVLDTISGTRELQDTASGCHHVQDTAIGCYQVQDTITDFKEGLTEVDLSELDGGHQDPILQNANKNLQEVGDIILSNLDVLHRSHTNIHGSLTFLFEYRDIISSSHRKENRSEDEMSYQELLNFGFRILRNVKLTEKKVKSDYELWKRIEVGVRKFSTDVRRGEMLRKDTTTPHKIDSLKLSNTNKVSLKAAQIRLNESNISICMSFISKGLKSLLVQQKINCQKILTFLKEKEFFDKAFQNVVNPSVA